VTTAFLSTSTPSPTSGGGLEPWILGVIVGGALLALLLIGLAVFFLLKRRRAQEPAAAELKQQAPPDVGDVPQAPKLYADVSDVRSAAANVYGNVNVSPPNEYDAPDSKLQF
jgi:hypothetical protein